MEKTIKVKLNLDNYSGQDLYSDGPIEDELLQIVKNYDEEDLNRVIAEKNDWTFLYHFSHIRENIVSWLPITKEHSVLEIGSGCGAITGVLSDMAKDVTCIELSKKRSEINAYRHYDRENIEIMVGNFKDIEKKITQKYDYITLIGVFEYAEGYMQSKQPYEDFLNIIKRHLKPDGTIVIAIENRWGLKYWAGCREDHSGIFFDGINGYKNTSGVKTFTKKELIQMMNECGYNYRFYYPYPDYKLPYIVYSDEWLPKKGELYQNHNNFDRDRFVMFDEGKVYDDIIEQNMYPQYANSFLVLLTQGDRI